MDGPGNSETPSDTLNGVIYMMCNANLGGPIVYLQQVPNEDLSFPDHPQGLGEDALIAYTWRKFLDGNISDPTWLLRLPMTRAGVNAMTAVQDFFSRFFPTRIQPTSFLVSGASKRGWTTWTVAAVDSRVSAAVPIVMPIPDVVPNIAAEWRAYGNWSFALKDYVNFNITRDLFARPGVQDIANIVGPMPYIERFTMPVWNIIACGDEFTLPDSPRFWWNKLPGEKFLRAVPNAEHSMACCAMDVVSDIITFYYMHSRNLPRPQVNWNIQHSTDPRHGVSSITVNSTVKPDGATMWWANTDASTGRRDFRLVVCWTLPECVQPVLWFPRKLTPVSTGPNITTFAVQQGPPAAGWTGFLVQLDFTIPNDLNRTLSFRITTEVAVTPDTFPFAACPPSECGGTPPQI